MHHSCLKTEPIPNILHWKTLILLFISNKINQLGIFSADRKPKNLAELPFSPVFQPKWLEKNIHFRLRQLRLKNYDGGEWIEKSLIHIESPKAKPSLI